MKGNHFYSSEDIRDFLATFSSETRSKMLSEIEIAQQQIALELTDSPRPEVRTNLCKQQLLITCLAAEIKTVEQEWKEINARVHCGNAQ